MKKSSTKISITRTPKLRAPHRSTLIHRNRKKYTRKGRIQNRRRKELIKEGLRAKEE